MALGTARDEIKRSDELWNNSNFSALRTQQEKAFGYFGPYEYKMDTKEGSWDEVTTNSPKIIANKILGLLASSSLQLFIDVEDETRAKRKEISATEQLANGSIWLADRALTAVPSGKSLQSALSFFASVKGGTVKSVYFYEDDDGKVIPDIRVYDPTFCQWLEGAKKLLWFCHRNYVSKYFLEQTYEKQIKDGFQIGDANDYGKILTYTLWDDQQWKVAINGEYVDEEKHNLGYIPANIRSCGAAPYIQSEKYSDTMKWSWQNVFGNDWDIIDLESELLSFESSKARQSAKIVLAGEWDSEKSGGSPPEGLEKLGYSAKGSQGASSGRNEIVLFDAAKGQKFGGMVQPPGNEVLDQFLNRITGMRILNSIDPIAFGQMTRSGSGILAAELRAAALEFIFPFRKCVEEDFIWIAEECIHQFKNGQFGELSAEGRDAKGQKFQVDISAKDVEEKHFDCHLVPDRLRDEAQELGLAIQKVQNRLSSRRTVMVKHNIVEDPDREIDAMEEEFASQDPVFKYVKLAKYYKDQGTQEGDLMAAYSLAVADKIAKDTIRQQLMPVPGEELVGGGDGAKPPTISPQAETARVASEGAMMVQEPKEAQRVS